jgi:hypothetical protein
MAEEDGNEEDHDSSRTPTPRTIVMDEAFLEALLRRVALSGRDPVSPSAYMAEKRPKIATLTELDDREKLGEFLMRYEVARNEGRARIPPEYGSPVPWFGFKVYEDVKNAQTDMSNGDAVYGYLQSRYDMLSLSYRFVTLQEDI